MLQHFARNTNGKDYVVGDIHGCFTKLQTALNSIGFDESKDRLFTVGDLVDRGPESDEVLDWLAKPWFFSTMGNHEEMALDCAHGWYDRDSYLQNGGAWFLALDNRTQQYYAKAFKNLPYVIEVETASGLVGILHAECDAPSWDYLKANLKHFISTNQLLWGRNIICDGGRSGRVDGINMIYVGHTPVMESLTIGSHRYMDRGTCFADGKDFYIEELV